MESEKKMTIQDQFQNGEVDTMVATTAFGMGVDKDNVELVAHYEISSTLENYVQEAGRAGRDPKLQASCIALSILKILTRTFKFSSNPSFLHKKFQPSGRF
jgi:ATP-dependent DNA helicase RecQ